MKTLITVLLIIGAFTWEIKYTDGETKRIHLAGILNAIIIILLWLGAWH